MLTQTYNTTNALYSELHRHMSLKDDAILGIRTRLVSTSPLVYEVDRMIEAPVSTAILAVFSIPCQLCLTSRITVSADGKSARCVTATPDCLSYLGRVEEIITLREEDCGCCGQIKIVGDSSAPEWAKNVVLRRYKNKRLKHLTEKGDNAKMTRDTLVKCITN